METAADGQGEMEKRSSRQSRTRVSAASSVSVICERYCAGLLQYASIPRVSAQQEHKEQEDNA